MSQSIINDEKEDFPVAKENTAANWLPDNK
jgi:hypothetical protein